MTEESTSKAKIAFIGQPEYFRFTYENDLDGFANVEEFKLIYTMDSDEYQDLINFDADYNFFFRGEYVPDDVLQALNGINVDLSSEPFPRKINDQIKFTRDSMNRYCVFRQIRNKPYDYVFHYDRASLEFMQKDGLYLSGEFPLPVATNTYKPMDIGTKWDFFFIGRSTQHRELIFDSLKHHFNFLHIAHGIWGEDLVKLINQAKISLNVHAEDEISWEPRLQMLLACGAFVISEPVTPNCYFRPGIDYIELSKSDNWSETAIYYLEHPNERQKIATNGYHRTLELLESSKVFQELISDINNGKYQKFKASSGSFFWNLYGRLLMTWRSIKITATKKSGGRSI